MRLRSLISGILLYPVLEKCYFENLEYLFSVDEESPYAELWMGIHPKAPASMFDSTDSLTDVISKDKTAQLGLKIMKHFDQLPFLLKVLSVDRALSIQAHPNKSAAEILHAKVNEI